MVASLWLAMFGSGWSRRNGMAGTWCGSIIIIWNNGGSGHCIQGGHHQLWGNLWSGIVRYSTHPQR